MDNNKLSLLFNARIVAFEKLNDSFLKCKCYVMALGKNANKSHFSKESTDKAYSTLQYVPVIGHLMQNENGEYFLGGHDYKLDIENGFELKSQCVPFGVAIPTPEPVYEDVIEEDGTVSTYLTCEVILWTGRYPELLEAVYNEDYYFGQSMEILYSESKPLEDDSSYQDITKFSFDALCLLNKSDDSKFHVEPCFPSASIKPVTYSLDKDDFSLLMGELKQELGFCLNDKNNNKGGNDLNKKDDILKQYGKTVEDLDFSIDEISDEDFASKMKELFGETDEPVATESVSFSVTYNQKRKALRNALPPSIEKDASGSVISETYFYLVDFSDDYVYVEKDMWTADEYTSDKGRYTYTFNEDDVSATLTSDFEEMVMTWLTLAERDELDNERITYEKMKEDFEKYKAEYTTPNEDVKALTDYKENKEVEERQSAVDATLEGFSDIKETAEFKELVKDTDKFSIDELKKECIYIRGLHAIDHTKQDKPNGELKFGVEAPLDVDNDVYGGMMKKYLGK